MVDANLACRFALPSHKRYPVLGIANQPPLVAIRWTHTYPRSGFCTRTTSPLAASVLVAEPGAALGAQRAPLERASLAPAVRGAEGGASGSLPQVGTPVAGTLGVGAASLRAGPGVTSTLTPPRHVRTPCRSAVGSALQTALHSSVPAAQAVEGSRPSTHNGGGRSSITSCWYEKSRRLRA